MQKRGQTYVLFRERVDELRQNFIGNNGFSELIRVVSESSKSKGSGLLDGWDVVEKQRSQKSHNA